MTSFLSNAFQPGKEVDLGTEMVKRIKSLGLTFGEELACLLLYVLKRLGKYDV